jgi:flagellar protein FliO/FliZ
MRLLLFALALPFLFLQAHATTSTPPAEKTESQPVAPEGKAQPEMAPSPQKEVPSEPQNPSAATVSYENAFVKMCVTLVGLIILIVLSVWMLRRIAQGRFTKFSGPRGIAIVEKRALSQKSMLYLIEVKGKQILIAESQLEVRRLADIEDLPSGES